MEKAVKACNRVHVNKVLNASKQLLADTIRMDEETVAKAIDLAHERTPASFHITMRTPWPAYSP